MRINKSLITYQPTSGAGSGTVTSVGLSAPTGFSVSGSPIVSSGTLALAFTTGYGIPPLMTGNSGRFLTTNGTTMSWVNIAGTDVTGAAMTSSNDTNVQITLGGTPSTSLLRAVSLTMGWTGQLAVSRGGTGASTLTGVVIGNATSAMTAVVGTAGQFLRRNLANTAYEFRTLQGGDIAGSELTFANDTNVTMSLSGTPASALLQPVQISLGWTGQLAVSRGGTGAGTLTGVLIGNGTSAVSAITGTASQILRRNSGNTAYEFWTANYMTNPMTLEGSIIYASTGGTPTELFANNTSTNKYLRSVNGSAPTWEAITGFTTGSGTTNYVAKWTSSTALGDSLIYDNGTNVGIGVIPSTKLHVASSGGEILRIQGGSGTTGNNYIGFRNGTTDLGFIGYGSASVNSLSIYNNQNAPIYLYTNALQRLTVTGSGDVGIGTINPVSKLDIAGSINISSNFNLTWGGAYGTDIPTIVGVSGSGSNGYLQFYPAGSTSGVKMALRRTGQLALPSYTSSSSFTGTSVATLAVDAAGDVITIAPQQTTASGTYTPTWTGLANVDSVTAFSCQYMRVGDTVTVSGWVTINATVDNTSTSLSFSLPINSATTSVNYLNGTGVAQGGGAAACLSGYGTNYGEFAVVPLVDTSVNYSFHFTYRII